jgi:hypothetical protein
VREEVEIERNEAGGSCCVCVQRPDLRWQENYCPWCWAKIIWK